MSSLVAVLFLFVVFSASLGLGVGDEVKKTPLTHLTPPLTRKASMEIIRNIQEIMRNSERMRGKAIGEKRLGVVKLMNHLKNRLITIPFKFNYMAFKPDLF